MSKVFAFQKITGNEEQIYILYQLLKCKKHNISHTDLPIYEEHRNFVLKHPYRVWYLIKCNSEDIGSVYLQKDNSIGLFLLKPSDDAVKKVLRFILNNYKPLTPRKSIRSKDFFINVAPNNKELANALEQCSSRIIQVSYAIDENVCSLLGSEE